MHELFDIECVTFGVPDVATMAFWDRIIETFNVSLTEQAFIAWRMKFLTPFASIYSMQQSRIWPDVRAKSFPTASIIPQSMNPPTYSAFDNTSRCLNFKTSSFSQVTRLQG